MTSVGRCACCENQLLLDHIETRGFNQRQLELAFFLDQVFVPAAELNADGKRVEYFDAGASFSRLTGKALKTRAKSPDKSPKNPWSSALPTLLGKAKVLGRLTSPSWA